MAFQNSLSLQNAITKSLFKSLTISLYVIDCCSGSLTILLGSPLMPVMTHSMMTKTDTAASLHVSPFLPFLFLLCSFCATCTSFYFLTFCLTVDHSRVRLTPIEGVECSDYINANYVTVSFYSLAYETLVSVNVTLGISCLYMDITSAIF